MKFEDINGLLKYLVDKSNGKNVDFDCEKLEKTKNLLKRFPHNPKVINPEVLSYDTDSLREFKKRYPFNKVINSNAYIMTLFDFDDDVVFFIEFGDIASDGIFIIDIEVSVLYDSEIKTNKEAMILLDEYYKDVEYDEMNDSVDYHSRYEDAKSRKQSRNSEIAKMFENFTIIY